MLLNEYRYALLLVVHACCQANAITLLLRTFRLLFHRPQQMFRCLRQFVLARMTVSKDNAFHKFNLALDDGFRGRV